MAKVVYEQWRETYEVNIIGVYIDEDEAYRVRENKEYELKDEGYDTDEEVRVWIEDVEITQ